MKKFLILLINLLKRIQNLSLTKYLKIKHLPLNLSHLKVAFIMDGNRRFALKVNKPNPKEIGLNKLKEVIYFCNKVRIKEANFFILSVKNLGRPKKEFEEIESVLQKETYFDNQIEVIGNLTLLQPKLREKISEFVIKNNLQAKNKESVFRFFICYDESDSFDKPVDLIIRTGNVFRLSGFLVRQAAKGAKIHFLECLWPEFVFTHFMLSYLILCIENYLLKITKKCKINNK
ncbi:undecaprenyl pyrophosphate synthetase [Tubulinosema ratisbonensis]|uniref:Undecaprenyl pyrophosphate synthetase n=1 Tax=Tubulinosema ratisbonensis TaxID=291195 RepID=A0A437AM97_9MICR|nr:undecaprenyl pyrophosphate synthetase [Tubulinosema ratisbonensis]